MPAWHQVEETIMCKINTDFPNVVSNAQCSAPDKQQMSPACVAGLGLICGNTDFFFFFYNFPSTSIIGSGLLPRGLLERQGMKLMIVKKI